MIGKSQLKDFQSMLRKREKSLKFKCEKYERNLKQYFVRNIEIHIFERFENLQV